MITKSEIRCAKALNDASEYGSSFARGIRVECNGFITLYISGTASIDKDGKTVHVGDFESQVKRTFQNIEDILGAEGATWHDVVYTSCFLRDIERDYDAFNKERTLFYKKRHLATFPASTAVQAILCRPDLLVEIQTTAIFNES